MPAARSSSPRSKVPRSASAGPPVGEIASVRSFNRFYTREIGLLRKTFLDTPWSLGEMRVMYEIANRDGPTASEVARDLDLDAGYLSRLLRAFEAKGLIRRAASRADARQQHLRLTAQGKAAFAAADKRQRETVAAMLGRLDGADRLRLVAAMRTIERLLALPRPEVAAEIVLREPAVGDLGWIVARHAELYGREYGWGGPFEAMCARICADFGERFDARWERGWIAEVDGERAGCILLVKDKPEEASPRVARIRLLLLEPWARGLGLGRRLVEASVAFAREAGYRRITLWTHQELTAARAIYAKVGFTKSGEETHDSWGKPVVSEFWDMDLSGRS